MKINKKQIKYLILIFSILLFLLIIFPPFKKGYIYMHLDKSQSDGYFLQKYNINGNTLKSKTVLRNNKEYYVYYVPKKYLYPAFGYSVNNIALVRSDLKESVSDFVIEHELYHCTDGSNFGGWISREIRASVFPGVKDFSGLFSTLWASASDFDRIKFYFQRFRNGR